LPITSLEVFARFQHMPFFPNWLRPTNDRDYELGIRAFDQGLYEEAVEHLSRCVANGADPATSRLAKFYLGESYSRLGQASMRFGAVERSAELLQQAIEQHPQYADLYFNLALVQRKLGRQADAVASVGRSLGINPDFAKAIVLQGLLWYECGREEDGIQRIASASDCEHVRSDLVASGLAAHELGNQLEAIGKFEAALSEPCESTLVHIRTAEEAYAQGDFVTAVAGYRRALSETPQYADLHCRCGFALLRLDRCPEAAQHFEAALAINPAYIDARLGLAQAFLASGMMFDAREALQQVLNIDPDHPGAKQMLEGIAA
jgi:tetratricopeptide (TPR) repeat protein